MYQGQTMKLPTYNLKLDELIFNFTYDNTKKAKDYINHVLEDDIHKEEKDEDVEKLKAKVSKETKSVIHDSVIKDDDQR